MSADDMATKRVKVTMHDREFQKYSVDRRIYCIPVDETEEERLVQQYEIIQSLFGDRLYFPPIEYPEAILDCGYGRGSWAIAMAEQFEEAEVIGIDVYPLLLEDQPENLDCYYHNLNEPLTRAFSPNTFDLIHSRFVGPGIKKDRWPSYVQDIRRLLKPGGWVQMVEYYYAFQSHSGRLTEEHKMRKWYTYYAGAVEGTRDPRIGRALRRHMENARLTDVHYTKFDLPIGDWPNDERLRSLGLENRDNNITEFLESQAIWPFTQTLGWTKEQVEAFAAQAYEEAEDASLKLYIEVHVAWGRKRR